MDSSGSASQIYRTTKNLQREIREPVPREVEGISAMLDRGCSWRFSGDDLERKQKKSQPDNCEEFMNCRATVLSPGNLSFKETPETASSVSKSTGSNLRRRRHA